jgi:hypothetical protein
VVERRREGVEGGGGDGGEARETKCAADGKWTRAAGVATVIKTPGPCLVRPIWWRPNYCCAL